MEKLWCNETDTGYEIGFTEEFLNSISCVWHILPARASTIRKNGPILSIETNDELICCNSPVEGFISKFNSKARDFPEHLSSEDVVLKVEKARKPGKAVEVDLNLPPLQRHVDLRAPARAVMDELDVRVQADRIAVGQAIAEAANRNFLGGAIEGEDLF